MDPIHGEISRAMRNRGVEVFLVPEVVELFHKKCSDHDYFQSLPVQGRFPEDSLALLSSGGLEHLLALRVLEECKKSKHR